MINQERVREMTRMAMLECGMGEKELQISACRKTGYVVLQLVKGFIAGTICFAALFLLWLFWKWDQLNQYFTDADFEGLAEDVFIRYVIFLAAYLVLAGVVAAKKHKSCKAREKKYLEYLYRLKKSYSRDGEGKI